MYPSGERSSRSEFDFFLICFKIDKVVKTFFLTAEAQRHREKINNLNVVNSASLRLIFTFYE